MAATPAMLPPKACCRKCYYPLAGGAAGRCPECGRAFDPADPKSFLSRPPGKWRWFRRAAICVLIAAAMWVIAPRGRIVITSQTATTTASGIRVIRYGLVPPSWMHWMPYPHWTTRRALTAQEVAAMQSPAPGAMSLGGIPLRTCKSSIEVVLTPWWGTPVAGVGSISGGADYMAAKGDPRKPAKTLSEMLDAVTDMAATDGLDSMATYAMPLPE